MATFTITSGTDKLKGTSDEDKFDVANGGSDLSAADKVDGGAGIDTIKFVNATVTDDQFTGVKSVETVTVTGGVSQVTLGALATGAGINTVDGTVVSDTLVVDASGYGKATGIQITAGTASITDLTGSKFDDAFTYNKAGDLDGTDLIDGGAGHNKLVIGNSGNGFGTANIADAQFAGVTNVQQLDLRDGQMFVVLGANAANAGITDVFGSNISDTLSVDASGFTGDSGIAIHAAPGVAKIFIGSAADDRFFFTADEFQSLNINNNVDGGGTNLKTWHGDILEVDGDGKTTTTVNDIGFSGFHNVATLQMVGKTAVTANLGAKSDAAGISIVETGAVTGLVTVDASARSTGIEIYAGSGANKLTGTIDDDTFFFTSKGLSGDTVDGKGIGDHDRIAITDKAAVVDAAFSKVTNVEAISLGTDPNGLPITDYTGAKVTLGGLSAKAGIVEVDNNTDYALTLDASARGTTGTTFVGSIGDDIFVTSSGGADTFTGGGGNDSFRVKLAALDGSDFFAGGVGTDEIRILDSQDAKNAASTSIVDADFTGLFSVEHLVFDGTGKQSVTLASMADQAGLAIVDASKVAGGLTLNAAGMQRSLSVYAGTGVDHIQLGGIGMAQNSVYIASSKLTSADELSGGSTKAVSTLHFTDAVKLTDAYFVGLETTKNITNFHYLMLDSAAKGQSLVAGVGFSDFTASTGIRTIIANSTDPAASFTFDFSGYTGNGIGVAGGAGNDVFIGGPAPSGLERFDGGGGDDSFRFLRANFPAATTVDGEAGNGDEIAILSTGATINDIDFTDIHNVEILRFAAAKSGNYSVILGTTADATGIVKVDGASAGVNMTVHAGGSKNDLTVLASTKDNTITTGDGHDTIAIDAKSFNANDLLDAGTTGADTLAFTTGGAVGESAFTGSKNFEFLQLADAGNAVVLKDSFVQSSDGTAQVFIDGGLFRAFDFAVLGGKGNDTVDLSKVTNGHIGVVAGGGNDSFIGSQNNDVFLFGNTGELTASDKVDGGAGEDTVVGVAGTYSSDQFKGFKNVESFETLSGDSTKGSTIVLKNAFMETLAADAAGRRTFQVLVDDTMTSDDVIDASAVTGTLNSVTVNAGAGIDTLTGGAGSDTFIFGANGSTFLITAADQVDGGGGRDTIDLLSLVNGSGKAPSSISLGDAALAGVTSVERIAIDGDSTIPVTLTLADNAAAAGITEVDASAISDDFTLNAANYGFTTPAGITLLMGTGNDDITLSGNDDIVRLIHNNSDLDGTDAVEFGGGTDTIQFEGSDDITDTPFLFVKHVEVAALMGAAHKITVDKFADASGLQRIDAAQAQQSVTIDAQAMSNGLKIIGSSFGDTIDGTKGNDIIWAGAGGDAIKGGGGTDVFVFYGGLDSTQGAGAAETVHMDKITDFADGDALDFSSLTIGNTTQFAVRTAGAFVTDGTAGFFSATGKDIVAQFDGTNTTRVYADVNGNGDFDIGIDAVVQLNGDQTATLDLTGNQHSNQRPDPLRPELTENSKFELSKAGTFTDVDFATVANNDVVLLSSTKGDYTINGLGTNSEQDGLRFFDGSAVTGKLTIDASGRADPVYIASGKGVNDLKGTAGDDVFYFTSAGLTAKDQVDGGPDGQLLQTVNDRDTMFITDKSTLVDAAFAGVKDVEILEFGPSPIPGATALDVTGQKVVLGAKSEAATIDTIINDYDTGLTVDASGRGYLVKFIGGAGDDVLFGSTYRDIAGVFSNDIFDGGAGNDSFRTKLVNFGFHSLDQFDGGAGTDEVRILDSWDGKTDDTKIFDISFQSFTSVERLVFDGTGKQFLTLGTQADEAGLSIIDASKVAGGLTLDGASGTPNPDFGNSLSVILGTGADNITLSGSASQNDVFIVSKNLTAADHIDAGYTQSGSNLHLTDAVKIADKFFAGLNVGNIAHLELDSAAAGQSFVAGANFTQFLTDNDITFSGTFNTVEATSTDKNTSFSFDFTAYTGTKFLNVLGSGGNDVFKAGAVDMTFKGNGGADSFQIASANLNSGVKIFGGDDTDEIVVLDAGTLPNGILMQDTIYQTVHDVEVLRLAAAKTGEYHVELGTFSDTAGIRTVDGSKAGVLVDIDAAGSGEDLTLIGGTKANFLSAGGGNDTLVVDSKSFNAATSATGGFDGGASGDGDILKFSTSGVVSNAGFGDFVLGIEKIQFSDAGNSLVVTNAVLLQSDGNAVISLPDGTQSNFGLAVLGGKGNDTVDLSGVSAGAQIAVVGNGGADKFTGSAGDDTFIFPLAGDLNAADVVKGGAGDDTVLIGAGTYGAGAFKGLASIELIRIADPTHAADSAVAFDNTFFANADVGTDGKRTVEIDFGTATTGNNKLDASAVTNTTASVHVFFGKGTDTFVGGAGADQIHFNDDGGNFYQLTGADKIDGGLGRDSIILQSNQVTSFLLDTALAGVSHVEEFQLHGGAEFNVALSSNAMAAGIELLDARDTLKLGLDATGFANDLTVLAGQGTTDDDLEFGSGDATVVFGGIFTLDASDKLVGGSGSNTVQFKGDATVTDGQFAQVTGFHNIALVEGTFSVTLGTGADNADNKAGIDTIDASKAGHGSTINVSAMTGPVDVTGSVGDDTIAMSKGGGTVIGGSGGDALTGNIGNDHFKYTSTADSVLLSSTDFSHMDTIDNFTDGQNDTIDLTAFGFLGTPVVTTKGSLSAAINDGFASGPVAVFEVGGTDTYVFADTNKNGTFDFNSDLVIKLVGTHGAVLAGGDLVLT